MLARLGQVWQQVEELASLDPAVAPHLEGREALEAQLEDLAFFLRSYAGGIDGSSAQLGDVEARLAELEQLKKKYGPRLADVLEHRTQIDDELEALSDSAAQLEELAATEGGARQQFIERAQQLSTRRHREARNLDACLVPVLADLAIPHARFDSRFGKEVLSEDRWTERGIDELEYYFSANPGEAPRPLARVASGGELSRVMLGLKTLASTDVPGKTLVFDEIDAGIGGGVADRVGTMLRELGERFQVLCVTHLPQIAAYATAHHHVSKVVRHGRTVTRVEELAEQGRVTELARLMTGGASRRAQEGARELLYSKQKAKGRKRKGDRWQEKRVLKRSAVR